ncbi:diacylglycerol/lipid kinase family protein [Aquamicrobium ahrensii]|uniref:YegS/Rv2252/BmrU family lipid kinase n=1 Tax=Aquamicrobium ahrensii TaxID=469551 RepID=A0ABV2KIT4_9HYPH
MKVGVILNPVAGGGRLRNQWPQLQAELRNHFAEMEVRETQAAGDAERLALDLVVSGCGLVIAVGGDGTASEVADGILLARREGIGDIELALLPCGTGSDFARGLGVPRDAAGSVRHIAQAGRRRIDVGRISFVDDHGALASRHFINIASLGLSGVTVRAVNADKRKGRVSARALFYWRTIGSFLRYNFQTVRITLDDGAPVETRMALVAVANGRFFGAGMMVAPDAEMDDGWFDVIIVRAAGKPGLIRDLTLLYGGRHRNHPAVTIVRAKKVLVEPVGSAIVNGALLDIDGESPGRIPATFEILPGALILRC